MPDGTFKDYSEQNAQRKAAKLQEQNPYQTVFVIYDYEAQQFDAITEDGLNELYIMDWDFTVVYEL